MGHTYVEQTKSPVIVVPTYVQHEDDEVQALRNALLYEKALREKAERELREAQAKIPPPIKKKNVTTDSREAAELRMATGLKSDGVPIPHEADAIRSWDDFDAIQQYFLNGKNRYSMRNYMMWVLGVSFGLRVSDLSRLKYYHIFDSNFNYRERIEVFEKKTNKLNNCTITEAAKNAINTYLNSTNEKIKLTSWLFPSRVGDMHIEEATGSRILKEAARKIGMPIHISSHSMRKSFIDIVTCVYDSNIDDNALRVMQGLLNHDSPTTTQRYTGVIRREYDAARIAVSDFILRKTDINQLVMKKKCTNNELMEMLCEIQNNLKGE